MCIHMHTHINVYKTYAHKPMSVETVPVNATNKDSNSSLVKSSICVVV